MVQEDAECSSQEAGPKGEGQGIMETITLESPVCETHEKDDYGAPERVLEPGKGSPRLFLGGEKMEYKTRRERHDYRGTCGSPAVSQVTCET